MPKRRLNFQNGHIAAGGAITDALAEHRVLTDALGPLFFVIAHADDEERARQTAQELDERFEGSRQAYVVLFTDDHLTALAAGVELNLAVLNTRNHFRPANTAIKVSNRSAVVLTTELGDYLSEVATARDICAGDIYTCGVSRLGTDQPRGLAIYRAREDFDPTTGELRHHLVEPGQPAPALGKRTGALTDGPDQLVHRIVDKAAFLTEHNLTDLAAPVG